MKIINKEKRKRKIG